MRKFRRAIQAAPGRPKEPGLPVSDALPSPRSKAAPPGHSSGVPLILKERRGGMRPAAWKPEATRPSRPRRSCRRASGPAFSLRIPRSFLYRSPLGALIASSFKLQASSQTQMAMMTLRRAMPWILLAGCAVGPEAQAPAGEIIVVRVGGFG